jgi:hypothetical protein
MEEARIAKLYPWEKTDLVDDLLHFLNTKK